MIHRLEQLALVVLLIELPLVTLWSVFRIDLGPVLLYFGPHHGIHESDVVVTGLAVPAWWLLLIQFLRARWPRR